MLSFRAKLDLSYLLVLGVCIGLLFPISSRVVNGLVQRSLRDKTEHVLEVVRSAGDLPEMVRRLERQPPLLHRITIFKTGGELVYDSERARFGPMVPPQVYMARHPEVPAAFERGFGYGQFYSETLRQILVHMAVRMDDIFGETLVVRTAFPLSEVENLTYWFKVGFFGIGLGLLCVFMAIVVVIGYHLSAPIRAIMTALRPYYDGRMETLPRIKLRRSSRGDEMVRLAETINDLSQRTDDYIRDLKFERTEREMILSYLSEGVLILDRQQRVIYANAMAMRLQTGSICRWNPGAEVQVQSTELRDLVAACLGDEKILTRSVGLGGPQGTVVDATAVPREQARGVILILQKRGLRARLPILEPAMASRPHTLRIAEVVRRLRSEAIDSVKRGRGPMQLPNET